MANRTVYNASLVMTADVKQAKSALEQLSNTLKNLVSSNIKGMSIGDTLTNDLLKAQQSAIQLQNILSKSTNINTGKLDLTKFSDSLKKAKLDLNDLYKSLSTFGVQGEKAFLSLTNQLMSAEIPLKRTSKLFDDLWITMKNTMKWQLTSSVMHGFVGTMKSAVGYAQDLNKSLNNIRIVTGYNTDQMAKFARQANEVAKVLKTTTTAYTDAALIYYQQGNLSDSQIKARADATIKMANVTGESAKAVSDYMTAIWNNFDNGSKSLEYYADVMTALGAATASSTDEIAAGLEKFAAVSETVGLSYEYATAALATVTAETRQSADVVGNAFKTLFSRIQGLNLGETQDDGTTLNKYSAALDKVGISIKDTSGEIKAMDVILNELGSKWDTLGNDTQLALAQAVAGVRQYTQLIALMDNWDTFKINLDVAKNSSGTLNEQQEIYAESWEAASKKVKASLEGIYDSVINDKAIIKITDGFADFLNLIENVSDSLGGMQGILFGLGAIVTKVFSKQMAESLNNVFYSFRNISGYNQMVGQQMRQSAIAAVTKDIGKTANEADAVRLNVQLDNLKLQESLLDVKNNISQEDYDSLNSLIQMNEVYGEILAKATAIKQEKTEKQGSNLTELLTLIKSSGGTTDDYLNIKSKFEQMVNQHNLIGYKTLDKNNFENQFRELMGHEKTPSISKGDRAAYEKAISDAKKAPEAAMPHLEKLYNQLYNKIIDNIINELKNTPNLKGKNLDIRDILLKHIENMGEVKDSQDNVDQAKKNYEEVKKNTDKAILESQRAAQNLGASVTGALNGITSLGYAINSLSSIKDVFNDDTLSNWEKMVRITTSLSFGLSGLINGFRGLSQIKDIGKGIGTAIQSYGEALLAQEKLEEAKASAMVAAATQAENAEGKEDIAITTGQIAAEKGLEEQKEETAKASLGEAGAQKIENAEGKKDIAITTGQTVAEKGLNEAQKKALATILSKIKSLGWYALAIGAVAAIIYTLVKAYNADAEAAEKARKNLEEATQAAESSKQAYSDLLTSIENYNNAKSAIEDLTYGTQEWKDAIYEANQEVLALIKNYPILASYLNRDEDSGLLTITQEGQNIVQQQANLQKINAQNAMLAAQMISNTATNRSNITNAYRNDSGQREFSFIETKYNSAAQINNQTGTSKETTKSLWEQDYRNLIDKITYDQNYLQNHTAKEIIEDLGLTVERYFGDYDSNSIGGMSNAAFGEDNLIAFVESIRSTPELFNELAVSVRANIEANKAYAEQIIQNNYAENATYKNSKNKDALDTILSGNISSKAIKDRAYKYMHDGADGENDAFYQEEYAKAMGYQHIKDKNNGKGVYLINGKEETISDDVIYQWYALNKIIEETTASLPNLESKLEQLRQESEKGNVNSQAAYSIVKTGSATAGVSVNQLTSLKENPRDEQYFKDLYGEENFEAIWSSMGYESGQEFVEAFNEEIKNVNAPSLEGKNETKFNESIESLSLDAANNLKETMEQLELGPAGAQAGADFLDAFNKLLESGLSQEAIEALAQIDWSKEGSLEEGKQILEDLGYNAENFSGLLEGLAAQAYQLDFSVFEDLKVDLESIAGIISGLDLGSILSEEDYQLLAKYVDELENYFMLTSQGRKFIGTDEDANMIGEEAYKASVEELKKRQAGQKEFEVYGHDENGTRVNANWNQWALNADNQTTYEKETYKQNQLNTLNEILTNESAETLGLIGNGYESWKEEGFDTSTLTSDQIAQFFGELAEFTSNKIDESDFQENDQKIIGDSQNINEFDQNVEMVGGYEKAGLTQEQYENQRQYFQDLANEQAKAAQSYQELNQLMFNGEINQEAYQRGLVEQAKQYPALSKEVEAYEKALADANGDTSECTKEWNELNRAFKSNQIGKAAKDLKESKKTMEDLNTALGEGAKVNEDYIAASQDMADSLSEIFGVQVDPTFVQDNIEDIFDYIETGSGEILQKLNQKAIIAASPDLEGMLSNMTGGIDGFITKINELNGMSFNITGTGDFSTLQAEIGGVKMTAQDLGNFLNSLANSGMLFELENMEMFQALLEAIQNEDLDALQQAVTDLQGEGMTLKSNDNSYPADTSAELDSGGYSGGGGGGGGSDKVDRDKLSDALADTYKKKRDRLRAQYEGLDPEAASQYIKEEIALLEEEQKILEEQIKTWKGLLKTKVQEFNQEYADELGFDLTLNDDGEIANLSEIYQRLIQMYDEGNTDLVDKIYDKLQESAGIQASIDEAVQGMMDKEREQAELELKDITDRIDWRIKQIDYQIKRLNYYQEKLLIQAHGNKQTIEAMLEGFQYQEQEMLKLFEKGDALRQGIDELNAAKAKYPNHQQMFNEQILEYQSDLIDLNQDILELRADMEELVQEVLELALDEIDIQNERINKYVSMLDRFQNIIDLSGRSILDQALKVEIGTAKLDTLINKMSISKQTMEGLAEATKLAQEALEKRAAAGDETSVSMWENQVEELERELEAAQDDFLANWEEVLQAAADIFDMRVELTVQTLEQALSPFSSLDILEDRYNKEKELQEKYLDDATKLYELNKLNRQLNQSITDENDLLAKSKLRDIQEEILAYQKAGVDMSQYDLDILQKKYDLRLAEIALMEAQNSKTSMRLIRDAAGNWTYAYDADQTAIDEALQSVEDATYSLKKASTDYIDEMTEEMIAIKQEFVEAIGGLDRNSADYMEQLLYLQQHYMKEYNVVLGEFQKGVEGAGLTIHDTWYGATLDLYNFEDAQKHFSDASDLAINELMVNYKDWQKVVEQAMGIAGTSWETFGDDTGATLDSLEEHIQALCDEISKLVDVLMEYVATSIGMVEEWQAKYSKQVDNELAKNEAYINNDSLHQSRSGGKNSGAIDYLAEANGDYSLAMTLLIANEGQAGLNSQQFQDLATARTNKINESDTLKAQIGNQIITTEHLINVLTDTTKSEAALGSDVIASAGGATGDVKINYTQVNYNLSQDDKYESQSGLIFDFINGERGAGLLSTFIPSPSYGANRNYEYYNDINNTRSGWCSKWVGDVMAYNGADFIRGNAWDAVKRNSGRAYNGGYIANGTAVGSESGEYGHIGIYNDGYIYATSYSGNSLDRYTVDEWQKKYGKLYITNAGNIQTGQTAMDIFKKKNGNTYGSKLISNLLYGHEVDNNIKSQSNGQSLIAQMLKGFDTGGYTGTWGPYGRLALLHEKELVLNKADTSNILDAVKISRGVDDKISDMIAFTNNSLRDLLSYIKLPTFETQPIEQTVQIQAEFPGVTDQYEIQEALSNLSNDASQYLNIQRNFW